MVGEVGLEGGERVGWVCGVGGGEVRGGGGSRRGGEWRDEWCWGCDGNGSGG